MANHGWTWVRQAALRPNKCAVFPHIQQGALIDTGMDIVGYDPHVYIGETAAKELGKMAGMVPASKVRALETELHAADTKIADLQDEVLRLQSFKDAVEIVQAG